MSIRIGKRVAAAVGVLIGTGIILQVMFDPLTFANHAFEISKVRAEFPDARARWDAQKIADYTFEIRGNAPLICLPYAVIDVREDEVISVRTKDPFSADSPAQLLPPEKWSDPDWGEEVFLCDYANFTMTQIFDLLGQDLHNDPSVILHADFDPDYGFVSNFSSGLLVGHGLLSPRISECCSGFTITNFEPLKP